MSKFVDTAVAKFVESGYNCCQAVICACCEEYGVKESDVFKMTEGFGAGMGGLGDTCGAVTGMFLALSLANSAGDMENPKTTKMDTYKKFRAAAGEFQELHGSLYCRDIPKEKGSQPLPSCIRCVKDAAEITERMLAEIQDR